MGFRIVCCDLFAQPECLLQANKKPAWPTLAGKDLADDVFDGNFLDVDVADRKFVEQGFADGDDAVAFDLKFDRPRVLLKEFTVPRQVCGWIDFGSAALNGDEFGIGEPVDDLAEAAVE